jgi:Short C-terminal domain
MAEKPLHQFTSHISGKNAKVQIYADRIEWDRPRGVSTGKMLAGAMTLGTSLLVTGVKSGNSGSEMIPVKSITSVATKRDGMLNTIVQIITSGNSIDFRVSHSEAAQIRDILNRLILGGPAEAVAAPVAVAEAPAAASAPNVAEQLHQLGALRDAGVLSEDEFAAKKAELLARM